MYEDEDFDSILIPIKVDTSKKELHGVVNRFMVCDTFCIVRFSYPLYEENLGHIPFNFWFTRL